MKTQLQRYTPNYTPKFGIYKWEHNYSKAKFNFFSTFAKVHFIKIQKDVMGPALMKNRERGYEVELKRKKQAV